METRSYSKSGADTAPKNLTRSGSVRNPKKTVPLAMLLSVAIAGFVYLGVVLAVLASGQSPDGPAGLGIVARVLIGPWGQTLVVVAAIVSTLSAVNANVLGASELTIRLAHSGDISPRLVRPTRHGGHPIFSVIFGASITAALMLLSWDDPLLIIRTANASAIVGMVLVDAAAARLALRKWPGDGPRLPGGATIPILAALTAAAQLPALGVRPTVIALACVVIGLIAHANRSRGARSAERRAIGRQIRRLETPLSRVLRRRRLTPASVGDVQGRGSDRGR